jgi:hypothetical protein
VPEAVPPAQPIAEGDVASAVIRISLALEQLSELLEAANELHRKLVELHAVLAEPLLDLERSLTQARGQPPRQSGHAGAASRISLSRSRIK